LTNIHDLIPEEMDLMKKVEIAMKLKLDPTHIERAKLSICRDCSHKQGFNGEYYDCDVAFHVLVDYKREELFHTQIIKCTKYDKIILDKVELDSMLTTLDENLDLLDNQVDQLTKVIKEAK